MKEKEKNWLILIGIVLFLIASKPSFIYDVFNINFGGDILVNANTLDCQITCPSKYNICVVRWGPDANNQMTDSFSGIIIGGTAWSRKSTQSRICLAVGYVSGSYSITNKETFVHVSITRKCQQTPADVEFCLISNIAYDDGSYGKYRYVLVAEENINASGSMDAVDYLRVPIPNPPLPSEIDVWAIFNQLFSMVWNALKSLFGWLT